MKTITKMLAVGVMYVLGNFAYANTVVESSSTAKKSLQMQDIICPSPETQEKSDMDLQKTIDSLLIAKFGPISVSEYVQPKTQYAYVVTYPKTLSTIPTTEYRVATASTTTSTVTPYTPISVMSAQSWK